MEIHHRRRVLFFGEGEVAELAYLYLQLTPLELAGLIDDRKKGKPFFAHVIKGFEGVLETQWDVILLTRLDNTEESIRKLTEAGIDTDRIATI